MHCDPFTKASRRLCNIWRIYGWCPQRSQNHQNPSETAKLNLWKLHLAVDHKKRLPWLSPLRTLVTSAPARLGWRALSVVRKVVGQRAPNLKPSSWTYSIRRFPEIGVPPVIIHFNGFFHEIDHLAIGEPPWLWKTLYSKASTAGSAGSFAFFLTGFWRIHLPQMLQKAAWEATLG